MDIFEKDKESWSLPAKPIPPFPRTERLSVNDLERAAQLIKEGRLVAFPTETVYGLGAAIFNPSAIASIFTVKGRPSDNPLIAHMSSLEQVHQMAIEVPDSFYLLANSFFPGPLTVVLKRNPQVPSIISAGLNSIALRLPSHPIASKLISLVGEPLVAPSANLSGKPSSTQLKHVLEDFDGKIAAVIEGGQTDFGIESTVISLLDEVPILLRPGVVTKEQIEQVLGRQVELSARNGPVVSPGMKYRHYCPKTPIKLFKTFEAMREYLSDHPNSLSAGTILEGKQEKDRAKIADLKCIEPNTQIKMVLSFCPLPQSLKGIDAFLLSTKEFYSLLRLADQKKYAEILILCDEKLNNQVALMNRLHRSAGEIYTQTP